MAQGIFSPRNRQKTSEDRMKELEELAKLNRGGFTALAEDTKSNIPFMLPGQRMRPDFEMNQPRLQRVAFPESEPIPEEEPLPELQTEFPTESPQGLSASDFLDYFTQQFYGPDLSQGIASTEDGGVLYQDGSIRYSDGTVRYGGTGDAGAYPIASMADGSIKYSDGSIRALGQPGLQGLQQGIFGQDLPITQQYGNVNPGMGYANNIHGGVDLRTRNLTGEQRNFSLPVDAKVVQVITADTGSPYGNSVLLQLPSGEMLRFSHLSQIFNIGDTLTAGQAFGTPGSTGNSTDEHLDLEYYDPSGKRANPTQFQGFAKDKTQTEQPQMAQQYQQPQQQGQVLGATDQQPQQLTTPELEQPKPNRPMNMDYTKIQPNPQKNIGITAANMVDVANPTGNFDLGITENLRGNPEAGRLKQIETVENLGFGPELGSSERARAQGTNVGRQFIGDALDTLVQKAKQFGVNVGEHGITEKIAKGMTRFTPQAYAADNPELPTPGQGIDQLKSGGQVLGAQSSRPSMADISSSKVVGDVSGGDMSRMSNGSLPMDSAQVQSKMQGYDARDPFFRQGLNQKFASDIDPEKAQSGALTIDLFKPDFYKSPSKLNQAFSGTSLFGQARGRYNQEAEKIKNQFRSAYGSGYDQGDIDRILSSIPENADLTNLQLEAPRRSQSEPGVFNESPSYSPNQPASIQQAQNAGSSTGTGVKSVQYPGGRIVSAAPGSSLRADSSGNIQQVRYGESPVKTPSAQINQASQQPQQSIFSRISNAISRLFRR